MGEKLVSAKKVDRIFHPLINILVFVALGVAIVDFVFFQPQIYRIGWFHIAGVCMFVVGLTVYLKARHDLGRFFSEKLTIADKHEIVSSGIYRYIRHPIYLGGILLFLGLTLVLNSPVGFLLMLACVPVILLRIPFEEKMLLEAFGERYAAYAKRTSRLIPFIY